MVLIAFLAALFIGTIIVPQALLSFVPQLSFLFSNPATNLSLGFLSFNILGFIVTGAITLPILIIVLRRAIHTTNIAAQG